MQPEDFNQTEDRGVKPPPVLLYLAGPMLDHTGDYHSDEAKRWRDEIARDLPENVVLISPAHAFAGASPVTAPAVDRCERMIMQACDGVLVNLTDPNTPAFGSIRDIEYARAMNTPVAIAGPVKSLMAHDLIVRDTLDEAFRELLFVIADRQNFARSYYMGLPFFHLMPPQASGE